MRDLITVESLVDFLNTGDTDTIRRFDVAAIQPEQVRTFEVGARTTVGERLFLDATYYYSRYTDFIGFNLGVRATVRDQSPPSGVQAFRVAANAQDVVTTQGFSIGANLYFADYYSLNGNYSWNVLNTQTDDPIIPAFNTPEHKFNIGVSGRNVPLNLFNKPVHDFGFGINYKWVDSFIFEGSPQFTGPIPSYGMLDAQLNFTAKKINTTFKLGASNILNNQVFQVYGGPRIGRLAYVSATYTFVDK